MYEAFYGLRERPFNLTPDPKYLYLSDKHKEAFAHLLYGIKNRSGFVMISGEIGTGKTTICRNMLSQMEANTEVAFIFNPSLNPVELLRKINREFGIVSSADNVLALTEELNEHLLNAAANGKNSVLVIDEAQNLEPQVLEQIRLLSNLETDTEKLLQIILIGQPELAEKLALHELRQLNQRITARYHLKPMNAAETLQYIAFRTHVAGARKRLIFTKGAIRTVYRRSGGVPRMINALCDRALLIGYTREQHVITAGIVRQAAKEIRGEKLTGPQRNTRVNWRNWAPNPSLVVLAVLLLVMAHYLVDPLDRFTRELNIFNRILSGESSGGAVGGDTRQNPAVTADSASEIEEPPGPAPALTLSPLHLVMERLSDTVPSYSPSSFAAIVPELDAQQTLHAGIDALASLWNLPPAGEYPDSMEPESLKRYFQRQNLSCERLRPTTEQLLRMNLPGLTQLVMGERRLWMTILEATDDSVTLQVDANRRITIPQSEFDAYYSREFIAPWNDPAPGTPALLPGQRSERIRSFKEVLHDLGRLDADDLNDEYDGNTVEAVRAIQTETGLIADGKAGPQVRLALTSWTGDTPSLRHDANRAAIREAAVPATDNAVAVAPLPATPEASIDDADTDVTADDNHSEEDFHAIAESTTQVDMTIPESPVMSLPPPAFPEEEAPEDTGETRARERGAFNLLRGLTDMDGNNEESAATESASGLMEVRELPEPFAPAPFARPETRLNDSVTPPVLGSAPLAPREGDTP